MKNTTILFDLDDTLIHCNKYYKMVIQQFCVLMLDWFRDYPLTHDEIIGKQHEIDIDGIELYGFKAERFPLSFVETYLFFIRYFTRLSLPTEQQQLLQLGYSVYDFRPEPYPHMIETLSRLQASGCQLCLYSGGDYANQLRRLHLAGLSPYFQDRIFVTAYKNIDYMNHLILHQKFERDATWMIGNSLKTDILPAIHSGIHCIYIPTEQEWSYNHATIDITPVNGYYQISSLVEVPSTIHSHYHIK